MHDYYYDNISQYFVGADNTTVQVYKAGEHVQVETFYNYNGIKALIGKKKVGSIIGISMFIMRNSRDIFGICIRRVKGDCCIKNGI